MKTSRSPGLILAVISLPIFIGAVDLTVISAVLPHVLFDLELPYQSSLDDAAWLVTGYLLAYAAAMTFMGRLSDLIGRRRTYLLSLAVFGLGSLLVAAADGWPTDLALRAYYLVGSGRPDPSTVSLGVLIAARMIQAFGGGAMVPIGMAMVADLYPTGERARPLGVIVAVDTAGWVVGHLYGGIMVRYFGWRMIFLLNLPICLLALLLVWMLLSPQGEVLKGLERDAPGGALRRLDWTGVALFALGLTAFNLGLGTHAELSLGGSAAPIGGPAGSAAAQTLGELDLPLLVGGVALLALFLWWQSRARHPLVPLELFRRRNFAMAGLANFLVGFCLFVGIAAVPLFINGIRAETLEQGAWESGWMLSALTVPLALAAFPGGWLTARYGYRWPALVGLLLAGLGFVVMSGWQVATSYRQMALQLAAAGIGIGLCLAPISAAALDDTTERDRGVASGLVIIQRLIGMTIAISVVTSYGIQRANAIGRTALAGVQSAQAVLEAGQRILAQVVGETFLMAAAACLLALFPILILKSGGPRKVAQ